MDYGKTIREFEKGKKYVKKIGELEGYFSDRKEWLKSSGNDDVVYEVFTKNFSPLKMNLTMINPGRIGKEFYMTRGHVHGNETPEFYVLLEGKGSLLMKMKRKRLETVRLKKGEIVLVPEGCAHRLVNTGRKKLKVLTVFHEDSRPDYEVSFR